MSKYKFYFVSYCPSVYSHLISLVLFHYFVGSGAFAVSLSILFLIGSFLLLSYTSLLSLFFFLCCYYSFVPLYLVVFHLVSSPFSVFLPTFEIVLLSRELLS